VGYVPDGMSPDQYKKLKEKEELDAKKKNFAAFGPQSFRSRSLQSWHKDMEKGEAGHLMVCNWVLASGARRKTHIGRFLI
jgi:hypothetical protein